MEFRNLNFIITYISEGSIILEIKKKEFSQNANPSTYIDILYLFVEAEQFHCPNKKKRLVHTITGNRNMYVLLFD